MTTTQKGTTMFYKMTFVEILKQARTEIREDFAAKRNRKKLKSHQ